MHNDFPEGIDNQIAHRPWPLPDSPWLMTQSWHNLLFAHWPVDAALLRSRIPAGFALDVYESGVDWCRTVPDDERGTAVRAGAAMGIRVRRAQCTDVRDRGR